MFEEEEEEENSRISESTPRGSISVADPELVLEGKRWADGGFIYGFNAASAAIDFLRYSWVSNNCVHTPNFSRSFLVLQFPAMYLRDWRSNPSAMCTHSINGEAVFVEHPEDCSKFFICHGLNGFLMNCPAGTLFDTNLDICNHAFWVDCNPQHKYTNTR